MDRAIIYAAGNPDFYPAEYYDPESGSYQGAIPEFLAGFARTYGYELRYLQPGAEDRRAELAENQQVDLISACGAEEHYAHVSGEPVLLFSAEEDGAEAAWGLFLTQVAPGQFQSDLREYAARTTQAQWTGALLEAAGEEPPAQVPAAALAGAGLAALALLAALAVSLFCLRREKRRKEQREGTDPETAWGQWRRWRMPFRAFPGARAGGSTAWSASIWIWTRWDGSGDMSVPRSCSARERRRSAGRRGRETSWPAAGRTCWH